MTQRLPDPTPHTPPPSPCAWCGDPYFTDFEVEPAKKNQKGIVTKRAITVPVCRAHWQRLTDERFDRIQRERAARNQATRSQQPTRKEQGWRPPKII